MKLHGVLRGPGGDDGVGVGGHAVGGRRRAPRHLGLGLPVIGDHAHITVGGFASVGGITASSFRYGMFVDVIQRLEYVDWDGEVHSVGRADGAEELDRLLTGLGRHGVITKVTVSVIEIDKHSTYCAMTPPTTAHGEFIDVSRGLCAKPARRRPFLRGLWVGLPPGGRAETGWHHVRVSRRRGGRCPEGLRGRGLRDAAPAGVMAAQLPAGSTRR
jgi:hypothetical protein